MNQIIKLKDIDSTNNLARKLLSEKKLENGDIVYTDFQISGKGQGENTWQSNPGDNILMSYIYIPDKLLAEKQFCISMAASLSVKNFIDDCINKKYQTQIKWPNDIIVNNKKIAGILIENESSGQLLINSIIGIGININQENFENLPLACSLKQISKKDYNIDTLIEDLKIHLHKNLQNINNEKTKEEYLNNLFLINTLREYYSKEHGFFHGQIIGIDEFGRLKIETTQNQVYFFDTKEVDYLL